MYLHRILVFSGSSRPSQASPMTICPLFGCFFSASWQCSHAFICFKRVLASFKPHKQPFLLSFYPVPLFLLDTHHHDDSSGLQRRQYRRFSSEDLPFHAEDMHGLSWQHTSLAVVSVPGCLSRRPLKLAPVRYSCCTAAFHHEYRTAARHDGRAVCGSGIQGNIAAFRDLWPSRPMGTLPRDERRRDVRRCEPFEFDPLQIVLTRGRYCELVRVSMVEVERNMSLSLCDDHARLTSSSP